MGSRKALDVVARGAVAYDGIGQSPGECGGGVHEFAAAHHPHRAGAADEAAQVRSAAPGRGDRQACLDEPDARVRRLQSHVAGERQFGTAADRVAVQQRQDGHRAKSRIASSAPRAWSVMARVAASSRTLARSSRSPPAAKKRSPAPQSTISRGAHGAGARLAATAVARVREDRAGEGVVFLRAVDGDPARAGCALVDGDVLAVGHWRRVSRNLLTRIV